MTPNQRLALRSVVLAHPPGVHNSGCKHLKFTDGAQSVCDR